MPKKRRKCAENPRKLECSKVKSICSKGISELLKLNLVLFLFEKVVQHWLAKIYFKQSNYENIYTIPDFCRERTMDFKSLLLTLKLHDIWFGEIVQFVLY